MTATALAAGAAYLVGKGIVSNGLMLAVAWPCTSTGCSTSTRSTRWCGWPSSWAETVLVRYGLAGGKRVTTPAQALAGAYPALLAAARSQGGAAAGGRYLLAAP